jgi:hypothetical protein
MVFVNRHVLCRAVDFTGGGDDQPRRTIGPRGFQDVKDPHDIGLEVGLGRRVGVGNADQRGQMENGIAALAEGVHHPAIPDVPEHDLQAGPQPVIQKRQVADARPAVVAHQGANFVTRGQKFFDHMTPDEPSGARHGYLAFAVGIHLSITFRPCARCLQSHPVPFTDANIREMSGE